MASPSFYDSLVSELMGVSDGSESFGRDARRYASLAEDERLRGELGYSRKKGKNERLPDGSYALAEYPYLHYAIWQAKAGLDPTGAMPGMFAGIVPGSPEDQAMMEKRKKWGETQESMLKPGGFWNWM